jgi:murein peptide amidase A
MIATYSVDSLPHNDRPLDAILAPAEEIARRDDALISKPTGAFAVRGERFCLPRYVFKGPPGGGDPVRLGIFAGVHGDEPAGTYAAVRFLQLLAAHPEIARGYYIYVYPVCNPSGFVHRTRHSARGRDLNREFWNNTNEPEVIWLQSELCTHAFHGIISLHSDDTSAGLYGFVRGATLSRHLLEPALKAAGEVLPINSQKVIDGFPARNGIITRGYTGVLSAPPRVQPRPFELVLETPALAPQFHQEHALVLALKTILIEYQQLLAFAPNL